MRTLLNDDDAVLVSSIYINTIAITESEVSQQVITVPWITMPSMSPSTDLEWHPICKQTRTSGYVPGTSPDRCWDRISALHVLFHSIFYQPCNLVRSVRPVVTHHHHHHVPRPSSCNHMHLLTNLTTLLSRFRGYLIV